MAEGMISNFDLKVAQARGANRNTQSAYEGTAVGVLSTEMQKFKEAGMPYDVAKRLTVLTDGYGPLVHYFLDKNLKTVEEVNEHIKSIGCWADGTDGKIYEALVEKLNPVETT